MAKPTPSMTVVKPIQFTDYSYTRDSEATYYDDDGIRQVAAADQLRFGYAYNPSGDLVYIGAIIEAESVNYISSDVQNSSHWLEGSQDVVAVSSQLKPDGSTGTVYSIEGNSYSVSSMTNLEDIPPGQYVFSAYIKSKPSSFGVIELGFGTNDFVSTFSEFYSIGLVAEPGTGNPTVTKAANGWYRVSVVGTIISGHTVNMRVTVSTGTSSAYGKVMVTDLQLEPYVGNNSPSSFMVDPDVPSEGVSWRAADLSGSPPYVVSTNIPEDDEDAWLSGDAYVVGNRVMVPELHRVFEAVEDNTDKYPPDNPTMWVDAGATNAWRMLDMSSGADIQSEQEDFIETTFLPGSIADAVCLLNISGISAQVIVKDGSTVIKDETIELRSSLTSPSYYAWHFGERMSMKDVLFLDLPPKRNVTITIRVTANDGDIAKIGKAIIGRRHRLGFTVYGASAGITSYSTKTTDTFGNTTVLPRRFVGKIDISVVLDRGKEDFTHRKMSELRDIPAVYIGHEKYRCLLVLGFFNDFRVLFSDASSSFCAITATGI